MAKDKNDTGLGHTVSHTDTAQGKGGGQMTQDPAASAKAETKAPRGAVTKQDANPDENAKERNFRSTGGDIGGGADPEDVAERMGSTGKESGIA